MSSTDRSVFPRSDGFISAARHPLDPLSAEEIALAAQIVHAEQHLSPQTRYISIELHEPPKEAVLAFLAGDLVKREAFLVVLDPASGQTHGAVVSLTAGRPTSWREVPGVQPCSFKRIYYSFLSIRGRHSDALLQCFGLVHSTLVLPFVD